MKKLPLLALIVFSTSIFASGYSLPKVRKLTKIEKEQKKLIQCLEKIISKRKGGSRGPLFAEELLLAAVEEGFNDLGVINKTISKCDLLASDLRPSKKSEIDYSKFPLMEANTKVSNFISALTKSSPVKCIAPSLKVKAAIMDQGGQVGVAELKCLMNDGRVRNYPAIEIGLIGGAGVGLEAGFNTLSENVYVHSGKFFAGYALDDNGETQQIALPGVTLRKEGKKNGKYKLQNGVSIGAGYFVSPASAGAGFRFFNGKRRWGWLLDQLK